MASFRMRNTHLLRLSIKEKNLSCSHSCLGCVPYSTDDPLGPSVGISEENAREKYCSTKENVTEAIELDDSDWCVGDNHRYLDLSRVSNATSILSKW